MRLWLNALGRRIVNNETSSMCTPRRIVGVLRRANDNPRISPSPWEWPSVLPGKYLCWRGAELHERKSQVELVSRKTSV